MVKSKNKNWVYFIEGPEEKIKIGVSRSVKSRMKQLQTGSPVELKLIRKIKVGEKITEQYFHNKFRKHRVHGEWFERKGKLDRFLRTKNDQSALKMIGLSVAGVGLAGLVGFVAAKTLEWICDRL